MPKPQAISIDGPVASGKTVVGKIVSRRVGFRFLDTGTMYRAVTWVALQKKIKLGNEGQLTQLTQNLTLYLTSTQNGDRLIADECDITNQLRDPAVENGVSLVAKVPGVRKALVQQQRNIALSGPIVMVGRDIGTVVLPSADVKIYLTASIKIRAQRRYKDLQPHGQPVDYSQIMNEIIRRDNIDSQRTDSPMRPAGDAIVICTDNLEIEELVDRIVDFAKLDS